MKLICYLDKISGGFSQNRYPLIQTYRIEEGALAALDHAYSVDDLKDFLSQREEIINLSFLQNADSEYGELTGKDS